MALYISASRSANKPLLKRASLAFGGFRMTYESGVSSGGWPVVNSPSLRYADYKAMFNFRNLFRDPGILVSPESLAKSIEANEIGTIVDLRTQEEHLQGHLKGSMHIAANEIELKIGSLIPVKTSRIFCYCQDGEKSYKVAKKLRELGYQLTFSLDGGIKAWMAKGYTVVR